MCVYVCSKSESAAAAAEGQGERAGEIITHELQQLGRQGDDLLGCVSLVTHLPEQRARQDPHASGVGAAFGSLCDRTTVTFPKVNARRSAGGANIVLIARATPCLTASA